MVTDRDICMGSYIQGLPLGAVSVSSVMSKELYSCLPEDPVADVERLMRERQIRRIPVVDSDGDLRGIVTLGDLARSAQQSAFQKTIGGLAITQALAAICEPRPPGQAVAAE
jgi:CBS-domain-containing membrane protein